MLHDKKRTADDAWTLSNMFKHKSHVSVRQRHRVRTHKNHVCRNETDECFEHRKTRPLELSSSISISFNKPLLNWHNGADIKRSWTGGWTRATANSKQALSTEERAGLQISAQSRIQWALMAVLRPAITQGGRDRGVWTYPLASELGAVSVAWLYVTLAGSQFTLRGFSWHCALGKWGCFSNSPSRAMSLHYRHLWRQNLLICFKLRGLTDT